MPQVSHSITYDEHVPPTRINPELPSMLDFVVARALKKDPAVRYQDADEMAADLHTCLAELRGRAGDASAADSGSKTVKLDADSEPTVGAPAAGNIVHRHPACRCRATSIRRRRCGAWPRRRGGRPPRPVGILRRIISGRAGAAPVRRRGPRRRGRQLHRLLSYA